MTAEGIDAAKFQADLFSDQRTLMGGVQREWLQKQLGQSKATWNVLAQQVLMAKMLIPQELLLLLGKSPMVISDLKPLHK